MRLLNVFAALSGAFALIMLVLVAHALQLAGPDADRMQLAAFIQLTAAAAALAVAQRSGKLNLIAGAMILAGAAIFSSALYALSLTQARSFAMLAPIGGMTLIAGWIALAFARPRPHAELEAPSSRPK
ncbi:MAG TPA: DUF423 domain-containing protein [Vitreimonas sp.]|uniref:DUF423 domain-containing protein n=1 Tax=Vitreimonas sp. TaxID=3069702 RepID=UPI002D4A5E1D|nr:DUF423 domain-containing protein [Vitreimonas sp.]HYD88637.1 DUF423 domain-containing protein [Vitreimonas sp.]